MARSKSSGPSGPLKGPLSFHRASGQWFVKRKGRFFYLGREHDAALDKYLAGKQYFDAGREPPASDDRLTVAQLVNAFLSDAEGRVEDGELSRDTFRDYYRVAAEIVEQFGRLAIVEDLRPADFAGLRKRLRKGRSLETLANRITRARVVLRYAEAAELIEGRVRFGKMFDKPDKDKLRAERQDRGKRNIPAADIRRLIEAADAITRPMVLLGIQAGFGPADLAQLPLNAVDLDAGWLDFPRPKTAVPRRVPLWGETRQAIGDYLAVRRKPKPAASDRLFINRYRNGYSRESVSNAFARLRDSLGLTCTHYDLRRTFRTVADATKDPVAIDAIMGHSDGSMGARYRQDIDDDRLRAVVDHVHRWLYGEGGEQ